MDRLSSAGGFEGMKYAHEVRVVDAVAEPRPASSEGSIEGEE
jgi:hypothetical protein